VSELPPGWASIGLREVATLLRGVTYTKSDASGAPFPGSIPVLRAGNIVGRGFDLTDLVHVPENLVSDQQRVMRGDVVVATSSGSISVVGKGAQAQVDMHLGFGAFCGLLRPDRSIEARYFGHYFASEYYRTAVSDMARGVNINNLKKDHFARLRFPVAPFAEQERIAEKLDALLARVDGCRARLDRADGILKRFRQSVLSAAISGELTREWREEYPTLVDARLLSSNLEAVHEAAGGHKPGNAAPPTEGVHDLCSEMFPAGWSLLTLRVLVRPDRPITYGILKPGPELDEGVPYVRVADYPNDQLNLATIRKTSAAMDQEFKRSRLLRGDLLMSIRGTVGRVVVVPPELERANITQDTARLSIQPEVNGSFVLWALRSELIQHRMKGAVKGVAVRGINIGDVRALQIPLPSRSEQDEIVRRVEELLSQCDEMSGQVERSRRLVERLTPSVLAKAFRGELVPQDQNDEPASALLTRLKANQSIAAAERPSRNPKAPEKRSTMNKIDKAAIKAEILKLKTNRFSFDELEAKMSGDYESLKVALFELLEEPSPVVRQVFDKRSKAMRLERVRQ
jgi:type I restriction enzyme S subunit